KPVDQSSIWVTAGQTNIPSPSTTTISSTPQRGRARAMSVGAFGSGMVAGHPGWGRRHPRECGRCFQPRRRLHQRCRACVGQAARLSGSARGQPGRLSYEERRARLRSAMTNVLERIVAYKRAEVEAAKAREPARALEERARATPPPRDFAAALRAGSEV